MVTELLLLFLGTLGLLLLSSLVPRWKRYFRYKNLPPGPFCWPLVGYTPFLDQDKGHLKLKQLAKKYGGVFGIDVGSQYCVVLDDYQAVKTAFSKEEFMGRPEGTYHFANDQTTILEAYGQNWKEHRKVFSVSFRSVGVGTEAFQSAIMEQVHDAVSLFEGQQNTDVNIFEELKTPICNVTLHLVFGSVFDKDHPLVALLHSFAEAALTNFGVSGISSFFPWVGVILRLTPKAKKAVETMKLLDEPVAKVIKEHRQTLDPSKPRDFIDHFLIQMDKSDNTHFDVPSLMGNAKGLLIAAGDPPRVTLCWFLLLVAKYPAIQSRIQTEIDSVLGREREPRYEDRNQLPFFYATLMESMRFRNILHLNFFRRAVKDSTLCGFDIPEDAVIIENMTSMCRNPEYWPNPDAFQPERFLSEDGSKVIVPEYFSGFSRGKRNCPGDKVALTTLVLFGARLLQRFRVLPPEGGVNLDMKTNFDNGIAHPFVRFQLRK